MNKAFTMAEVLITIGVVGLIAALTIPQLIEGYQKKETVTRLKRSYTLILQAIRMAEGENDEFKYWDFSLKGEAFFERYLAKHFNHPIIISTTDLNKKVKRKKLNGTNYYGTTYTGPNTINFLTNDGSLITFNLNSSIDEGLWVGIDTNGLANPNVIGRDTFLFFFSSKNGLIPLGKEGTPTRHSWHCPNCTRGDFMSNKTYSCNKAQAGYWCAAVIMEDNWEIKSDYPW